jgi:hypothetical protein
MVVTHTADGLLKKLKGDNSRFACVHDSNLINPKNTKGLVPSAVLKHGQRLHVTAYQVQEGVVVVIILEGPFRGRFWGVDIEDLVAAERKPR